MSDALHDLLLDRAARADGTPVDAGAMTAVARERAEQRRRARRNVTAAGGGAALIAALVAAAVVLPSSGSDRRSAPAGRLGTSGATPNNGADRLRSREATAAAAAQSAVAAAASRAAASRAAATAVPTGRALVGVVTPEAAEVAIGLVPRGWRCTGYDLAEAFYGPDSLAATSDPDFDAVIVVDVHERVSRDDSDYPLTVNGRSARYGADDGVQLISVIVDPTTELDVQIPASARVTEAQALQMAATLDLRSKAVKTHG